MTTSAPHILVIEDEREIRELMALHLLRQGYRVSECADGEQGLLAARSGSHQLVILDWMMPGCSGLSFLKTLRSENIHTPVLMVTARAEPMDIVEGLESGADDYLTKPFEPAVLMARVRALLRRVVSKEGPPREFQMRGLAMNFETYEVTLDGVKLHLTPSEFKLLGSMVLNQGRVMTRESLIDQIQGEGVNVVGRTVDTHVFGLRKKLGTWSDHIETIRGIGYRVRFDEGVRD